MNVLLLGAGGGGGNILRSVKALFRRDLAITHKFDPKHAERLRRAVSTRFLDTNEFSLADIAAEERVLIGSSGTARFGSRHDPEVARAALEESRRDVERLIARYSVVVIIASGGKGTGAGTVFPLAEIARQQHKLVIPIFVRPSFEHHEVEKRRYDHALRITQQFDAAKIRFIEILNERGYDADDPQPQSVVWERMNQPIARGLRGLLYVLADLSQVDPSDLSTLFAGEGRLRMGFAEIEPASGREPTDEQIDTAAHACWDGSYYAFRDPAGTSLLCIHGDWSNVTDAKIKSRIARLAVGDDGDHPYNPLYVRAARVPRPWGVSGIFSEHTGAAVPLDFDWSVPQRGQRFDVPAPRVASPPAAVEPTIHAEEVRVPAPEPEAASEGFSTFWEFAVALNRQDPSARAIAQGGVDPRIVLDGSEVRKLLTTVWFRSAFQGLSEAWRERLLDVLAESLVLHNHVIRTRRGAVPLDTLDFDTLKETYSRSFVADAARGDLELLLAIGRLWGAEAVSRVRFEGDTPQAPSRIGALIQSLRP